MTTHHVNLSISIIFWKVKKGLKTSLKDSTFEKNYWKISASHDGYLKKI